MAQTATLTRAILEAHDPRGGKGGRWLCPLPACAEHTDPRRHRSLSVNPESGLWLCHRCHAQGQLQENWKPLERKTRREREAEERQRRRDVLARMLAKHNKFEDEARPVGAETRSRLGTLHRLTAPGGRICLRYVESRGFTSPDALALLEASGVRFSATFCQGGATENKPAWRGAAAVVFPLRDHQKRLVAVQGRMVAPLEGKSKAVTLADRNRGAFVTAGALNALEAGQPIAICEAPFDALSLALYGLPAIALCGCNGIPEWIMRCAFNRPFLIAFDADKAGDSAAEKLAKELRGRGGMVERLRPEGAKDFNELLQQDPDALRALVARAAAGPARLITGTATTVPKNATVSDTASVAFQKSKLPPLSAHPLAALAAEADAAIAEWEPIVLWQEILHDFERAPQPLTWAKSRGVTVPCIARWLRLKLERCEKLFAQFGLGWSCTAAARAVFFDLDCLRIYLEKCNYVCKSTV